jgi:putative flippase GtrA
VRFVLLGGANTLASTVAFYLLSLAVSTRVAWTIAYAAGIAFVVVVTPGYVFGARAPWRRRFLLGLWYVCTYLVGLGVITLLESAFSAPRIAVVLGTVAVTAPLGFLGARLLVGSSTPDPAGRPRDSRA